MNKHDLELIRDYLDDRITADRLEQLNRLLEEDVDARAEFRSMSTLEEGLRDSAMSSIDSMYAPDPPFPTHRTNQVVWPQRMEHLGIAALLMICCGLGILLWQQSKSNEGHDDAIARIEYLSDDIRFNPEHRLPRDNGMQLGKGWVRIDRGHLRLLFRSGASVRVEGPVALGIDTPMRAYLDYGKVEVFAPESARDFVVATQSMEVVDLGTRFEVGVDPNTQESNVSVIEGLVDLHLGSRGAERSIRPLEAGFAATVNGSGEIVEIRKHLNSPAESRQPNESQLLAHWTFDDLKPDGTLADSTGNGLSGTYRAGMQSSSIPGIRGQALDCAGNGFVDLNEHVTKLAQADAFTFSAWVKDYDRPIGIIFSLSGDTERHRIQLHLFRRHVVFGWQDGLHYDSITGRVDGWNADQWYHMAIASRDGVVRLYCDGELIASGSVGSKIGTPVSNPSLVKNPSHAYLGRLEDGHQGDDHTTQWYGGKLDDVQFYSRALNTEAIRFIYEHPGQTWNNEHQHETQASE